MKEYDKEIVDRAKALYVSKKWGSRRIARELQKDPELAGLQQSTISTWIKKGDWRKLRAQVEQKTEKKLVDQVSKEREKSFKNLCKIENELIRQFEENGIEGDIGDLINVIKTKLAMLGEPVDGTQVSVTNINSETSVRAIQLQIAAAKKELEAEIPPSKFKKKAQLIQQEELPDLEHRGERSC